MNSIHCKPILAHQIGLYRIALVVDQFYDRVQAHPHLREPFRVVADWGDHKARLTYFWWVTLGGSKVEKVNFDVISKHVRAGFNNELLQDWIDVFRQVVFPVVGKELTDAWMERVVRLGRSLLLAQENGKTQLAKAS